MTNPNNNGAGDPQRDLDIKQQEQQPQSVVPTCPKCGAGRRAPWASGAPLIMTNLTMGPMLVGVFHCGNPACGAIFSVQVLQMAVPAQRSEPLIHRPV